MNKSKFIKVISLCCLALGLTLTSCNKSNTESASALKEVPQGEMPIAVVQMDSITMNYTYAKEVKASLEKDVLDNRATLESKAGAFQKAAQEFERKAKINAFVSQEAAQAAQNKILKMQQEAQQLQLEMTQKLGLKEQMMMKDLADDIKAKLKTFNNGQYKLILTNTGMDNVLYADEAMDITAKFLQYLNENYKSSEKEAEKK